MTLSVIKAVIIGILLVSTENQLAHSESAAQSQKVPLYMRDDLNAQSTTTYVIAINIRAYPSIAIEKASKTR